MNSIPNQIIVNIGNQHSVQKTIDDFFLETKEFIEENYDVLGLDFEIKSGEIAYQRLISNDRVTYLSYRDMILAGVLETRTEFNYVQYTFFRNIEGVEEMLKDLKN